MRYLHAVTTQTWSIRFHIIQPLKGKQHLLDEEKFGIIDLLQEEEANVPVLIQLAKSVTKNVVDIATTQEALEYVFTHITDCVTLLNKRIITKEILFKYLHRKNVAITGDITKAILISKVLNYWGNLKQELLHTTSQEQTLPASGPITHYKVSGSQDNSSPNIRTLSPKAVNESDFPIHLLARKFSEWFFNNYNRNELKSCDFWSDARLLLRIAANDGFDEHECHNATAALDTLYDTRQRFSFFFNPNLTHAGVQGRMDVHGLVVVLACGTLHTENDCVGLFECAFGLLRDPFSDNNWKTKTIQLMLRSKGAPSIPSLVDSDTLREALTLPVPDGEIT